MKGIIVLFALLILTACATTSTSNTSNMANQPVAKKQAAHVTAPPMMGPGY
jgi:hypothetical protein